MTTLDIKYDMLHQGTVYTIFVADADVVRAQISPMDRAVINQPAETMSDQLVALEQLFRCIERSQ